MGGAYRFAGVVALSLAVAVCTLAPGPGQAVDTPPSPWPILQFDSMSRTGNHVVATLAVGSDPATEAKIAVVQ